MGDNPFAFGQYGGLGAVWIRSQPGQPGAITLTASHPLLGQAEIQVPGSGYDPAIVAPVQGAQPGPFGTIFLS